MININVQNDTISGSYGKEQFVVRFTPERYKAMQDLAAKALTVESAEEYQAILADFKLLTVESYKELIATKCPYILVNEGSGEYFLTNDQVVSSIAIPKQLVDRIIQSVEKNIDFMPLVRLWIRFLRNPKLRAMTSKASRLHFANLFVQYIDSDFVNEVKYSELQEKEGLSSEVALRLATVKDVSITQEGLICTHKVVNEITTKWNLDADGNKVLIDRYKKTIDEDTGLITTVLPETVEERLFEPAVMGSGGDAFFCEGANGRNGEGHFIKVGCVIRLSDWSKVDQNDDRSCVRGLHTGGLRYVKGWQSAGSETLDCFVDPMHVGALDHDGTGAMRVLQFFAYGAWEGTNGAIYHPSTYAAKTDEQWAEIRKEVVEFFSKKQIEDKNEIAEINAL